MKNRRSRWVLLLALCGGCFGVPKTIRQRPLYTTFNPTGTWYKAGRFLAQNFDYALPQLALHIEPAHNGWFKMWDSTEKVTSSFLIADGKYLYRIATGGGLYVLRNDGKGLHGIWAVPDKPLGYMEVQNSIARHAFGDGDYMQGLYELTPARPGAWAAWPGADLQQLTVYPARGDYNAVGWTEGGSLVMGSAATTNRGYARTYGLGTVTHHHSSAKLPFKISMSTFEVIDENTMWAKHLSWTNQPGVHNGIWIEVWGREPVTKEDFYAQSCKRGYAADCNRGAPAAPAGTPEVR
jgi:hypothetical protein